MKKLILARNFLIFSTLITLTTLVTRIDSAAANEPTLKPVVRPVSRTLQLMNHEKNQGLAVEADLSSVDIDLSIGVSSQRALARAVVTFSVTEAGNPFFLLDAKIKSIVLDGSSVEINRVSAPGTDSTELVVLMRPLEPGTPHVAVVDYVIGSSHLDFSESGVNFQTQMRDTQIAWKSRRHYFECYGPTGYESDQYALTLHVALIGAYGRHRIFANGTVQETQEHAWTITFPSYFSSSSFYLHITDAPLAVVETHYAGLERDIPITVYSELKGRARKGAHALPELLEQYERNFGPYPHASFIAYLPFIMFGGMEHSGAAVTTLDALGHELLHSWFGRCVSPSDGRSGWIDEAVVSWVDRGLPRGVWPPNRDHVNLGGFSIFERFATKQAYRAGPRFIAELDGLLANSGGMLAALKDFYTLHRCEPITTEIFQAFLETRTGVSLDQEFKSYVMGQ